MARARARCAHPRCRLPTRSWKFSLTSSNCWLPALGSSPHPPGRSRLVAGPAGSNRGGPSPHYDPCCAGCGCSHRPAGTAAWCALRMGPPCASRFCLLRDSGVSRRRGGPLLPRPRWAGAARSVPQCVPGAQGHAGCRTANSELGVCFIGPRIGSRIATRIGDTHLHAPCAARRHRLGVGGRHSACRSARLPPNPFGASAGRFVDLWDCGVGGRRSVSRSAYSEAWKGSY